jgi:antitoxin HicB
MAKHAGSSLDDVLKEEGVLEVTRAIALKDAVAWQVQHPVAKENITTVEMTDRRER